MISPFKAFRLAIKTAAWATPHVQKWSRERNLSQTEGFRHLECGNWAEAETHFLQALEEGNQPSKTRVDLLTGLAKAQLSSGKNTAAQESLEAALQVAGSSKGARAKTLSTLVDLQLAHADFTAAEQTALEIERLERSLVPPSKARIALAARNVGIALRGAHKHDEAIQALERALKFAEQAFGAKNVETGNALAELGAALANAGKQEDAQQALRRALEIHREDPGPASVEATRDIAALGSSLAEAGDLEGAAKEFERLVAMGERQIGGSREEFAKAQVRLATLYIQSGKMLPAREMLTQSIPTLRRTGGPTYQLALEAMACVEDDLGRYDAADLLRAEVANLTNV